MILNTMGWVEGLGYELLLHAIEAFKVLFCRSFPSAIPLSSRSTPFQCHLMLCRQRRSW